MRQVKKNVETQNSCPRGGAFLDNHLLKGAGTEMTDAGSQDVLDPRKRYLFLFAHPDDEVLIAGTMKSLLSAGAFIHAAWISSGDYFGGRHRREGELAAAMRILGVPEHRVSLLRLPSLGLLRRLPECCDRVAEIINSTGPDTIIVTAFEGGHPDHDAVNFIAYAGLGMTSVRAELVEFPLYNGTGPFYKFGWKINGFPLDGKEVLFCPLDDASIRCKYEMMRAYSSQWMYMLPARLACRRSRMLSRGEPYRRCPDDRDHALPPALGKVHYERWFNRFLRIRFKEFRAAVLDARNHPSTKERR
jgi:N-acetylglucosamine malate deacetylase 1